MACKAPGCPSRATPQHLDLPLEEELAAASDTSVTLSSLKLPPILAPSSNFMSPHKAERQRGIMWVTENERRERKRLSRLPHCHFLLFLFFLLVICQPARFHSSSNLFSSDSGLISVYLSRVIRDGRRKDTFRVVNEAPAGGRSREGGGGLCL